MFFRTLLVQSAPLNIKLGYHGVQHEDRFRSCKSCFAARKGFGEAKDEVPGGSSGHGAGQAGDSLLIRGEIRRLRGIRARREGHHAQWPSGREIHVHAPFKPCLAFLSAALVVQSRQVPAFDLRGHGVALGRLAIRPGFDVITFGVGAPAKL